MSLVQNRFMARRRLLECVACKHGHNLSVLGIRLQGGRPRCVACDRESSAAWRKNHRRQWNRIIARYRRSQFPLMGKYRPRDIDYEAPTEETLDRFVKVVRMIRERDDNECETFVGRILYGPSEVGV